MAGLARLTGVLSVGLAREIGVAARAERGLGGRVVLRADPADGHREHGDDDRDCQRDGTRRGGSWRGSDGLGHGLTTPLVPRPAD